MAKHATHFIGKVITLVKEIKDNMPHALVRYADKENRLMWSYFNELIDTTDAFTYAEPFQYVDESVDENVRAFRAKMEEKSPYMVVDMDFSNLEKRVMAHMTKEKKYDGGKADIGRMKRQFADALAAVALSGMYGACKYEDHQGCSYKNISNAKDRYDSAGSRHDLAYAGGELYACDSHLHHLGAKAWNALAQLQLAIEEGEEMIDPEWADDYYQDWERQRDELHGIKTNEIELEVGSSAKGRFRTMDLPRTLTPEQEEVADHLRDNALNVPISVKSTSLNELIDIAKNFKRDFHL